MSHNKPFTNTTFTKRVDHEAGRHRPPRAMKEPAVCAGCGAVYANRRWSAVGPLVANKKQEHGVPAKTTLCPACKQNRTGEPRGFVFLDGAFYAQHSKEIEQLLRNEAERAAEDNPLARILEWKESEEHQNSQHNDRAPGAAIRPCSRKGFCRLGGLRLFAREQVGSS